jgi:hypothetical protein
LRNCGSATAWDGDILFAIFTKTQGVGLFVLKPTRGTEFA